MIEDSTLKLSDVYNQRFVNEYLGLFTKLEVLEIYLSSQVP